MYRLVGGLAVVAALTFSSLPTHADAPTPNNPAGAELGIVLPHDQAVHTAGSGGNLAYHTGGSVQTGTHTTYAIYWNPDGSTSSSAYQSTINTYFQNVAAATGSTSNVYYSDTQYYQTAGNTTTNISYSESFGGSKVVTDSPVGTGCTSTAGGTLGCISDAQIQAEVQKVAASLGGAGLNKEYFVFLGKGVSTCYSNSSCFVSQFCAYHSHVGSGSSTYLYANMPYTGYSPAACGSGVSPNNNPDADSTINVTSHEANETITDALGNAWYDRRGYENGDKCAWNFGTPIGTTSSGKYNQAIGSGFYYLQQEWSNYSSGCVLTGT